MSRDGELFPETKDAQSAHVEFTCPKDRPLIVDKQGARRMSLPEIWQLATLHLMKYLTCEGIYSNLHSIHFKLLSHLWHGWIMNVPNILYNLLSISVEETQRGISWFVSHHGLIKLLVERSLRDVSQMTWG